VFGPIWGWVFDRTSFFTMRMVLNFGFALSIAAFFADGSPLGLTVGAIVLGIAISGGDLIWSLWATKYTTPDKVADYMAVHTFITGIRGAIAPFAAFQLANMFELTTLGWVAAGMILLSALMLMPEVWALRKRRGATQ
jgi:MFS family permease